MSNSTESYLKALRDDVEDLYKLMYECDVLIRYTPDKTEKYRLDQTRHKIQVLISQDIKQYADLSGQKQKLPNNIEYIAQDLEYYLKEITNINTGKLNINEAKNLDTINQTLNKFKEMDLKLLCLDLGIDWDGLNGRYKQEKILALVEMLQRQSRIAELIDLVVLQRGRRSGKA